MWKTRPVWLASAAQAADWPGLAEAQGSLTQDLALKEASGEPAGRGLRHRVFLLGAHRSAERGRRSLHHVPQVVRTRADERAHTGDGAVLLTLAPTLTLDANPNPGPNP